MLQNVPDDLIRTIERCAAEEKISISDEAVKLLQTAVLDRSAFKRAAKATRVWPDIAAHIPWTPPQECPSSLEFLREDRAR